MVRPGACRPQLTALRFTLLELLDVRGSVLQALLREQEALQNFHIAIATIEGLVGNPFLLTRESSR
jgi:cobalt-zinc-cadmium efflux system outer membrane protein